MRVLVACEFSARVRDEFRARGHDAWSVDIVATEGDPSWHYQRDVLDLLDRGWDMMIAFPPCTYLTKSNAWRWNRIEVERKEALEFVRTLMAAPIERIAIENPAGAIGTAIRKADQYVHPWQFGDPYQKMTGLWLTNLPKLVPEFTVPPSTVQPWCQGGYGPRGSGSARADSRTSAGAVRKGRERARTFAGIARAMAEQWGGLACLAPAGSAQFPAARS
jgi:hypothetical protein